MSESYRSVNQILSEHGESGSLLRVEMFSTTPEDGEPMEKFVLVEGDKAALSFLAHLILAHMETDICDVSLHPAGVGKSHFNADSNIGIYLHRLPCEHGRINIPDRLAAG
jgi:hypothetical protein